jgi:hypothetical protein
VLCVGGGGGSQRRDAAAAVVADTDITGRGGCRRKSTACVAVDEWAQVVVASSHVAGCDLAAVGFGGRGWGALGGLGPVVVRGSPWWLWLWLVVAPHWLAIDVAGRVGCGR